VFEYLRSFVIACITFSDIVACMCMSRFSTTGAFLSCLNILISFLCDCLRDLLCMLLVLLTGCVSKKRKITVFCQQLKRKENDEKKGTKGKEAKETNKSRVGQRLKRCHTRRVSGRRGHFRFDVTKPKRGYTCEYSCLHPAILILRSHVHSFVGWCADKTARTPCSECQHTMVSALYDC
jgi:hypothetical protein